LSFFVRSLPPLRAPLLRHPLLLLLGLPLLLALAPPLLSFPLVVLELLSAFLQAGKQTNKQIMTPSQFRHTMLRRVLGSRGQLGSWQ
jgi:hypothetical protein